MNAPAPAHDPRLVAALGPVAKSFLSRHIDPADAWLAAAEGLLHKQARSRARNAARSLGSSWPDRLSPDRLLDPAEMLETQHLCGLHAISPPELLEAVEAADGALNAADAAQRLAQADAREVDSRALAAVLGITQRRAQQIKAQRVDLAERQMPLFGNEEDAE